MTTAQLRAAVDRESPLPFYFQLAQLLEEEIVSGRWKPGVRLPSEPETTCPTPAIDRRCRESQPLEGPTNWKQTGKGVESGGSHRELAVAPEAFKRRSNSRSGRARKLIPRVTPFERTSNMFTELLPNSVDDGESLYRANAIRRDEIA